MNCNFLRIYFKLAFLVLPFVVTAPVWAQFDLSLETLARSFPQAVYVKATSGYSLALWDKRNKSPVLYGFMRPMLSLRSSGVINAIDGRMEIYPLSIFGIMAGRETVLRETSKLHTFNCEIIDCKGKVTKDYVGSRFALKYKSIFLMTEMRSFSLSFNHPDRRFTDELSTLEASPSKDRLVNLLSILGHEINDQYSAALLHMRNSMANTEQKSSMTFLLLQHKNQAHTFFTGPGLFNTRADAQVFSLLFLWNWKPEKGLLLF